MIIEKLISILETYPKDTMLYNSGNFPYWTIVDDMYVLSLVPVAKQKVEDLLEVLKILVDEDIYSSHAKHKRQVHRDTEIFIDGYVPFSEKKLTDTEPLTDRAVLAWFHDNEPFLEVKVGVGLPSYMVGSNELTVLVPRRYFLTLTNVERIRYINKLLFSHSGRWINPETGKEETLDFDHEDSGTPIPRFILYLGGFEEAEQK